MQPPDFYRFPKHKIVDDDCYSNDEQLDKIASELDEAREALKEWRLDRERYGTLICEARDLYGVELMDIIHAAETALRMAFIDEELEFLRDTAEYKNLRRGYYD